MSDDLDRIVRMVTHGAAELQCAAAVVLGELAPKDEKVRKALLGALKSDNEEVRLYAVEALARIDARAAAPHFIPLLAGAPRLRGRVQQVLVGLGDEIVPMLRKEIDKASPELRSGLLEVLGQFKSVDLSETLYESLVDRNPDIVKQAAAALRTRIEGLAVEERAKTARQVAEAVSAPAAKKNVPAQVAGLQLLQVLKSPASVRTLLEFSEPGRDPAVRSAALAALADVDFSADEDRVVAKLLPMLAEEDQAGVVSPALQALARAKVGKDHADRIFKLLKSPSPAVRLFAIRSLGTIGGARAADGLVEGLWNTDGRVSEEAAGALRSNPAFAKRLIAALEEEEDANRAWKLAGILRNYRDAIEAPTVRSFLKRCLTFFEKGNPAYKVYFEILRSAAPNDLRDDVCERARALLAKKRSNEALTMMKLLEREDLATGSSDFLLAVALLRTLPNKDIAFAPKDRSTGVFLFSKLVRRGEFPVLKQLEKDVKLLEPADLLYLGFVLIERQGVEREFGADVLRLLVKKSKSSREAQTAKAKLKTQGA